MSSIMPESKAFSSRRSPGDRGGPVADTRGAALQLARAKNSVNVVTGGGVTEPRVPVETRLVIGPNASLTGPQALGFFAGMCAVCLAIAGAFTALGFWPVLPFAGLELAALGAALWVVMRRNRYREVVEFEGERLRISFGLVGQGAQASCEWPRRLTRVWLDRGPLESSPTRLVLGCGASRVTLGKCLTDAERAALAARLKELLYPAWTHAGASPGATRDPVA
jgi:uncharacterized membrane protein